MVPKSGIYAFVWYPLLECELDLLTWLLKNIRLLEIKSVWDITSMIWLWKIVTSVSLADFLSLWLWQSKLLYRSLRWQEIEVSLQVTARSVLRTSAPKRTRNWILAIAMYMNLEADSAPVETLLQLLKN